MILRKLWLAHPSPRSFAIETAPEALNPVGRMFESTLGPDGREVESIVKPEDVLKDEALKEIVLCASLNNVAT